MAETEPTVKVKLLRNWFDEDARVLHVAGEEVNMRQSEYDALLAKETADKGHWMPVFAGTQKTKDKVAKQEAWHAKVRAEQQRREGLTPFLPKSEK